MPDKLQLSFLDHLSIWVGRAIGKLHWVLVGWWVDAPIARKRERELVRDIRGGLPFLFIEYEAEIVPNDGARRPPFGYALVTIAIGHLLLRFVRGRGEFRIDVAARGQVRNWRDWKDLRAVQMVLDEESEDEQPSVRLRNISDADHLLQAELPRLQQATSEEQWDLIKRKANALFPPLVRIR